MVVRGEAGLKVLDRGRRKRPQSRGVQFRYRVSS